MANKDQMPEDNLRFYTPGYSQKMTTAGILGNTIEEKTRAILGWTECGGGFSSPTGSQPSVFPPKVSPDGFGPERVKKRKSSSARSSVSYPYDLLNGSTGSRKCSSSSVSSLSSTTNELSSLLLSQELTPPPSPVFKNQANGVTVVTLPRSRLPPSYQFQTQAPSIATNQFYQSAPEMQLPISPVSPPATSAISGSTEDESILKAATFRPGASATEIFERLRTQVPHLSSEQSKFRVLLQTVANVIELEAKLAQLHEETRSLSSILEEKRRRQQFQQPRDHGVDQVASKEQKWCDHLSPNYGSPMVAPMPTSVATANEDVPDDLQEIDVTAFRCLVSEHGRGPAPLNHGVNVSWNPYQPFGGSPTDMVSCAEFTYASGGQTPVGPLSNPLVVDTMS